MSTESANLSLSMFRRVPCCAPALLRLFPSLAVNSYVIPPLGARGFSEGVRFFGGPKYSMLIATHGEGGREKRQTEGEIRGGARYECRSVLGLPLSSEPRHVATIK